MTARSYHLRCAPIVDLAHINEPTGPDAERKFVVNIHDALLQVPGKIRPADEWYVMSNVALMKYAGTHIEVPFLCLRERADLASIPVNQVAGEAVSVDLREAEGRVTLSHVQEPAARTGRVRQGDIVFGMMGTNYVLLYGRPGVAWRPGYQADGRRLIGCRAGP